MQFTLSTSSSLYNDQQEMDSLKKLGFTFSNTTILRRSAMHQIYGRPTIEINTLEELELFTETYGHLIFSSGQIEIYNGYRE